MPRWHIAPVVDLSAYAFSWLWVLVPLLLFGPDRRVDYLYLYMFAVVVTDIHRHYGLPYVYLDKQVRGRFPLRFTLFPVAMFVAFCASPYLKVMSAKVSVSSLAAVVAALLLVGQTLRLDQSGTPVPYKRILRAAVPACLGALFFTNIGLDGVDAGLVWLVAALVTSFGLDWQKMVAADAADGAQSPPRFAAPLAILVLVTGAVFFGDALTAAFGGGIKARSALNIVVVFAVAWNIWHVFMQKYGILRLYNAKSGEEGKVPGWVDRLLVFGWLPFFAAWLGPANKELIEANFKKGSSSVIPALEFLESIQFIAVPLGVAVVVFSVAAFVYYEKKVNNLKNAPRLLMALGTFLLTSIFLFVDPIKAYIAYGFSHAVEYMVFVWAYQRRRYRVELEHKPLIGRILKHPMVAYLGFIIVLGVGFTYLKYFGKYIFTDQSRPEFLDFRVTTWFFYWTVYQSMVHFYFDGFLWKMRLPTTRANI